MNILKNSVYCALLLMGLSQQASAQLLGRTTTAAEVSKSFLFTDLPDSIFIDATRLNALLDQTAQASASVAFTPTFSLQGKIVSAAHNEHEQMVSVVLKASNRLGAVFTLTRIKESNGKALYSGRILSRAHADAFEIVAVAGNYCLVKRDYKDLVEE